MEDISKNMKRIIRAQHKRIEKTLVVRTDQERFIEFVEFVESGDLESQNNPKDQVKDLVNRKREC